MQLFNHPWGSHSHFDPCDPNDTHESQAKQQTTGDHQDVDDLTTPQSLWLPLQLVRNDVALWKSGKSSCYWTAF